MDNSRAVTATMVGAVIGGVAGYLFFTEHGRSLRRQIEPAIEDISHQLANEGWKLLNVALGEGRQQPLHTRHQPVEERTWIDEGRCS